MKSGHEFLEHTADVYVRAWGDSLERMFEEAAKALYEVMTDVSRIGCVEEKIIEVEGFDLENLLLRWLEELLFHFDSEGFLAREINVERVHTKPFKLKAIVCGETFDPQRHESRTHVKAATYAQMRIWRDGELWYSEFVLDI